MAAQVWRVVAIYRVVTLSYAAALIIRDHNAYAHPAYGLAALVVMSCWTAVTIAAYARSAGRNRWLITADVAVAMTLVIATTWVETAGRINAGAPTLPAFWAAAPVLAAAVAGGPWAGIAAALAISGADLAEHQQLQAQSTFNGVVLLLIAGGLGGYVVMLGLRAERAADLAARTEASVAERDRIARGIHDSVLQVLALVSSRGRELGGEAAELGGPAAEQEGALRSLVTASSAPLDLSAGVIDVRGVAEALAGPRITVSCPASAALLPCGRGAGPGQRRRGRRRQGTQARGARRPCPGCSSRMSLTVCGSACATMGPASTPACWRLPRLPGGSASRTR